MTEFGLKTKKEYPGGNSVNPLHELYKPPAVQSKLEIGKPNDKYEKEANETADMVMMSPSDQSDIAMMEPTSNNPVLQLEPDQQRPILMMMPNPHEPVPQMEPQVQMNEMMGSGEEEEKVQMQMGQEEEKLQKASAIQKPGNGNMYASTGLTNKIKGSKGQGQALSKDTRQEMGTKIGADFSKVSVHTDSNAIQMNRGIGAKAFAHGKDIYFNKGQYNPNNASGKHLLAHELAHTVQQGSVPGNSAPAIRRQGKDLVQTKSDIIQMTVHPTDYGKFEDTKYDVVGTSGVNIEMEFRPDKAKVDANKIGLTQSARSHAGGKGFGIDPTQKGRMVKSGVGEGRQIDRVSTHGNPMYAAKRPGSGDKLGDTATKASWGQHATPKNDGSGDWNPAKLIDRPVLGSGGTDYGQSFETTALAIEGTQTGLYMGSVSWGWTYKNGTYKKLDFKLVSKGDPSTAFFNAAKAWNTAHTKGTQALAKGTLSGGTQAQVYKSNFTPDFTIPNNTVITHLGGKVHGTTEYFKVSMTVGATVKTGWMKWNEVVDKGDGGATIDLPITWNGTIQLDPKKGSMVALRDKKTKSANLMADLKVGTNVKVIDDSSAWHKVQVTANDPLVTLNATFGTPAVGGDGKIIGYVSKELIKK